MSVIRRYARQIAELFRPEKIILFGSFAYGTPRVDSDVDLLVVMPCANPVSQAVRIRLALRAPFPMDLLVRTPDNLQRRIAEGNWFLREIVEKGKVLYAKRNPAVGKQGRKRLGVRQTTRRKIAAAQ
jgi:predicted nucleotidyltransferase